MMKNCLIFTGIVLTVMAVCCNSGEKRSETGTRILLFSIHQERDVYELSDYGEPPQFAIWLENKEKGSVKTVLVTRRTATGDFEGKVECPVSLPAWIGAFREETGRSDFPIPHDPADDAVTGATPQKKSFEVKVEIPEESNWYYYVELNVSGDYTSTFPAIHPNGSIDLQGNGQPSIIYKGEISGKAGERSTPTLIGRTEQMYFSSEINPDLTGIDNAKKIFSKINVKCL